MTTKQDVVCVRSEQPFACGNNNCHLERRHHILCKIACWTKWEDTNPQLHKWLPLKNKATFSTFSASTLESDNLKSLPSPFMSDCNDMKCSHKSQKSLNQVKILQLGKKKAKNRPTVVLCCNATGRRKLRPIIIHKSKNSKALRNENVKNLGFDYDANQSAFSEVFQRWLESFNDWCGKKRRQCDGCHCWTEGNKIFLFLSSRSNARNDQMSSLVSSTCQLQ
ncbi:hypothetical protein PsorP6_005405 [Peronosclerospora sorghi]|uniref:Uncharacterized protein n=1 Tax=Peronosclerospora sorghi TaxID=230839 RepID=A0ACC0W4C4_9STRA|nr:hypothetical protein PsorP6_005405 [Peronosclerospora sorghi]